MNVLVFAANDSDNLMIENILRELKRRGHSLRIFSFYMDRKSTRMFDGIVDKIYPTSGLADADINWCDCIFRCHALTFEFSADKAIFAEKYTYIFAPYLEDHWHTVGREFMFTLGTSRHPNHREDCASMPVGNPKNDTPRSSAAAEDNNRFLFIDSGHFPFSHTGKVQVAQMLLSICRRFPEHTLVIKPRFLPTDDIVTSNHTNYDHLYKIMESECGQEVLPQNLVMPQEHLDMQNEIDKASCVIMLCTSAYVDVALRGKKLLIVEGLDNEDKHELRNDIEYRNIYALRYKSACVVNYKDILLHLPSGHECDAEHLHEVISYPSGASARGADVMEYIYETFLKSGYFPKIKQYSYETFKTEMSVGEGLDWNKILHLRLKNIGNEQLNFFNRITVDIDISNYMDFIDTKYTDYPVTAEGLADFNAALVDIRRSIVLANAGKLMDDPLNQAVYIKTLWEKRRWTELSAIQEKEVRCMGVWHFYMGLLCSIDDVDIEKSALHMVLFLREAFSRTFAKYECEEWWGIRGAVIRILRAYNVDSSLLKLEDLAFVFANISERGLWKNIPPIERETFFTLIKLRLDEMPRGLPIELNARVSYSFIKNYAMYDSSCSELDSLRSSWSFKIGKQLLFIPSKIRLIVNKIRCNKDRLINNNLKKALRIWDVIKTGYGEYQKLIRKFGADAYLHLTAGGTGDVYISNEFYNGYVKNRHQTGNAVMVCPGKSVVQTTELFNIDRAEELERNKWDSILHLLRFIGNETLRVDVLYYHIFTVYTGYVTWLESYKGWNLYNLMKTICFDGVTAEQQEVPHFDYNCAEIESLFKENNLLPSRTVILSPYVRWARPINGSFWERLAVALKECGYSVCTNSIGESEPAIKGTVPVNYGYRISVPFIEKAGYFIGLRSGFCDIVESANAKKVALYPHNCWKRGIANGTAMGSFSLNAMFERDNWLELTTSPITLSSVIENIITYFES